MSIDYVLTRKDAARLVGKLAAVLESDADYVTVTATGAGTILVDGLTACNVYDPPVAPVNAS